MDIEILAKGVQVAGEVLIGLMALSVHHRVLHEHKIDEKVFSIMKREQFMGILGIGLIVAGFAVEAFFV